MVDDGIVATSPTIPKSECTLAHRIVIRDLGDEYVVHMQIFEGEKHYFHQGNYYRKQHENALARAWACFETRARRTLHIDNEDRSPTASRANSVHSATPLRSKKPCTNPTI